MSSNFYAGFDLGTTNSAAAIFDGDTLALVRSPQGGTLTPSVVRVNKKGTVTVGARARRFLERDPENTRAEFKRLMGTGRTLKFPAAGMAKKPQELSALILEALCSDVEEQFGFRPRRAVVTVPALFEIPQNTATAEAGRLAGLERVELLQEPVASALAAGWTATQSTGAWLVYDLGGGTFDVSLLETRDGLLRVVGHDGDNFLGGRDLDATVVDWLTQRIEETEGVTLRREDPNHGPAFRQLALAAEEAKIELTRATRTVVTLASPIEVGDEEFELDLDLDRSTLEQLCLPLIDRSIEVCQRLLRQHGLRPEDLETVVLVGGPTVMPVLRRRIRERLGEPPPEGLDPMALVAQGAALYAATAGLVARAETPQTAARGRKLWLQYPAMTSTLTPHVVGRLTESGDGPKPTAIRLTPIHGETEDHGEAGNLGEAVNLGETFELDEEDAFVALVELRPRRVNRFRVEGLSANSEPVPIQPQSIEIVHGLTISDPPLSRSIGVALANDEVKVYFERGVPLPARRSFSHQTIESIVPGSAESLLKIPIVQGELEQAHLCRLVGCLEIPGSEIRQPLPVGTRIELTLELDRGGHLAARALIPDLDQVFQRVAQLLVPEASPEVLEKEVEALGLRVAALQTDAFRRRDQTAIELLQRLARDLRQAASSLAAARGGDEDAAQKARRNVLEIEAEVIRLEMEKSWPELEEEALDQASRASSLISMYGTPAEAGMLDETMAAMELARQTRSAVELQRQMKRVRRLINAAWYRQPDAWSWELEYIESRLHQATDLPAAQKLVRKAHKARGPEALRQVVQQLWKLMPAEIQQRGPSHESGIR